jgi:hypothetical protein
MMGLRTKRERLRAGSIALLVAVVLGLAPVLVQRAAAGPVLLGAYSDAHIIGDIDNWLTPTGKRVVIGGLFATLEYSLDVQNRLNALWNQGYVPFVGMTATHTTTQIASGAVDGPIREWAREFAIWASNDRRAFIAPLQEMNINFGKPYYGPPLPFQQAFRRIRQIFEEELIGRGASLFSVSWVFAPNGWSQPGDEFEKFYPGGDVVDIVAVDGYNFGGCPGPNAVWDSYDVALKPYLDRLKAMAPRKPMFIAETGTVDVPAQGVGDKNQWLQELFTRVTAIPRFRGVVYLNTGEIRDTLPGCPGGADYRLHVPGTNLWMGFWNAMNTLPNYVYWAPNSPQMTDIVFGREPTPIFQDVPTIHPFALEAGEADFAPWIHAVYAAGVTTGCATGPLRYCPGASVTRGQMAVFLLRAKHGANFLPPVATGVFADVPVSDQFAPWIERLAAEGITSGCSTSPRLYCPGDSVTRAQMAVFLLRGMHGFNYQPPAATGIFGDVSTGYLFAPWIEQLAAEGITAGCGGGNFCPLGSVTREQMAVFLVRAFDLQ